MKSFLATLATVLAMIAASIELDIYASDLPQMLVDFQTDPAHLQFIFSVNLVALACSGLIYGTLSDYYSQKRLLLSGLVLFMVGSLGCIYAPNIEWLIVARGVQGLGASAPIILGFIFIPQWVKPAQVHSAIALLNGVITVSMAGAPLMGVWLSGLFGWRANFEFILLLTLIASLLFLYGFDEQSTSTQPNKRALQLADVKKSYACLCFDHRFMLLTLLPSLLYACIMLYITLIPYLFIQKLQLPKALYSWHQMVIMLTFFILSLCSAKLYRVFAVAKVLRWGLILCCGGGFGVLLLQSLPLPMISSINASMCVYVAGCALCLGCLIGEVLNYDASRQGIASAILSAVKLLVTAVVLSVGHSFFAEYQQVIGWMLLLISLFVFVLQHYFFQLGGVKA